MQTCLSLEVNINYDNPIATPISAVFRKTQFLKENQIGGVFEGVLFLLGSSGQAVIDAAK